MNLPPQALVVTVPRTDGQRFRQRRDDSAPTSLPWPASWALVLASTTGLGLVAVVTGWYGASGEGVLRDQLVWLNLAVSGAVLAGVGNCFWLLRGRRSVGELRRALLVARQADLLPEVAPVAAPFRTVVAPVGWVQVDGMRKVHRRDCVTVVGKDVHEVGPDAGDRCALCADEQEPVT